jgi:hypothetical protein
VIRNITCGYVTPVHRVHISVPERIFYLHIWIRYTVQEATVTHVWQLALFHEVLFYYLRICNFQNNK